MWDYLRHATLHCLAEGSNFRPREIRWVLVFPFYYFFHFPDSLEMKEAHGYGRCVRIQKARSRNLIPRRYCSHILINGFLFGQYCGNIGNASCKFDYFFGEVCVCERERVSLHYFDVTSSNVC